MRFFAALTVTAFALAPAQSWAQNSSALATAPPAPQASRYPYLTPPPGATLTLEINAGKNDLLGMVTDLLSGVSGATLQGTPTRRNATFYGLLSSRQLETVLKDVTDLQLFQYRKESNATLFDSALASPVNTDALGFYEQKLIASGGRRLLYSAQGTRVVIVGLDKPRGIAFITDDGGHVMVGRLDGTVNTKPLAAVLLPLIGR